MIEGACERYDLDGVELDWARHYGFFKVGQERRNVSVMNDFVHQVRQRLDYYGERRGRPVLLASGRTPEFAGAFAVSGFGPGDVGSERVDRSSAGWLRRDAVHDTNRRMGRPGPPL